MAGNNWRIVVTRTFPKANSYTLAKPLEFSYIFRLPQNKQRVKKRLNSMDVKDDKLALLHCLLSCIIILLKPVYTKNDNATIITINISAIFFKHFINNLFVKSSLILGE